MTELEIMKRAKMYIDSLAKGIDPITGKPANDSDVIKNVRISRCLFYVSGILQKVIENDGEVQREKKKRADRSEFSLTDEQINSLRPSDTALSISKVVSMINDCIDREDMKKLKVTTVVRWLMSVELLTETVEEDGRAVKLPTDNGYKIGLSVRVFSEYGGESKYVVYSPEAQQFIFDNIEAISHFASEESNEKARLKAEKKRSVNGDGNGGGFENKGQPWLEEDDELLVNMFREGAPLEEICETFRRTKGGITARMVKLGLIENRREFK